MESFVLVTITECVLNFCAKIKAGTERKPMKSNIRMNLGLEGLFIYVVFQNI
jgi:hypothetical protein